MHQYRICVANDVSLRAKGNGCESNDPINLFIRTRCMNRGLLQPIRGVTRRPRAAVGLPPVRIHPDPPTLSVFSNTYYFCEACTKFSQRVILLFSFCNLNEWLCAFFYQEQATILFDHEIHD